MQPLLTALVVLAAATTVYVLLRGIFTMAGGKDITGEKSNRLMILRVVFQGLTIALVVVLFILVMVRRTGS